MAYFKASGSCFSVLQLSQQAVANVDKRALVAYILASSPSVCSLRRSIPVMSAAIFLQKQWYSRFVVGSLLLQRLFTTADCSTVWVTMTFRLCILCVLRFVWVPLYLHSCGHTDFKH
jgi:hypothetical protein